MGTYDSDSHISEQILTPDISEVSSQTMPQRPPTYDEVSTSSQQDDITGVPQFVRIIDMPDNDEMASADSKFESTVIRKPATDEAFDLYESDLIRNLDSGGQFSATSVENRLSRFSDSPHDASLEDLFHTLDNNMDQQNESMSQASSSHVTSQRNVIFDVGKNDLASKLRATIAQKQMENEIGQKSGSDLLGLMMGILKDDTLAINGLVFDDKLHGENLFPVQAVEFGRLVASLRSDESEDVIVTSCQKLVAFFTKRPEQKSAFVTQHGLLPLIDLLEVSNNKVICSVLQVINHVIKDNIDFQENACLVGLIPMVMTFAVADRPSEIRMEAAYFVQQLCQSGSFTLQMFLACRGIPVLVGFLEADYAKYREMIHLAIDGMWQVFKLQRSTPINDFCRIASRNGIIIRLINTLYSLNEATRLVSLSGGVKLPVDGSTLQHRSGLLDATHSPVDHVGGPSRGKHDASEVCFSNGVQDSTPDNGNTDSKTPVLDCDMSPLKSLRFEGSSVSNSLDATSSVKELPPPSTSGNGNLERWKGDTSQTEFDTRHRISHLNRTSADKLPRSSTGGSNGLLPTDQVRPLLSLLEKEPPYGRLSGQLEYVQHLSGLERHESILPLLNSYHEKKRNGELDYLMAEFAEVSRRGKESGNVEPAPKISNRSVSKKCSNPTSVEGATSMNRAASRMMSGVISGSGVLCARPGSSASSGLLSQMVSTFNTDVAREYLEKVADLLLEFSKADTTVKSYMCSQSLLSRLFQMFNKIEPPILLKVLKCINNLSTDPNCLENIQRADGIKYLIPNLELKEGPLISQIHNEVLNSMFNLCKINKRRQEQAAESGIIPHLMNFIMSGSSLKQHALPLLCDMAHASRNSREQLRAHGGLDVYLSLLEDDIWSVTALDAIAVCLAHDNDNRKVEQALVKKDAVQKFVKFFQCCPEPHFIHILEPFLKIMTKSSRINTTLAVNGLTPLLITKLDHQDAIARLNLLKLIKCVYEHHPRPKQLIVENHLPQKLQSLIEERQDGHTSGGQVLVKQMATSLLKALHINTVL